MEQITETENKVSFDEILSRLEAEQRVDPAVTRTADYLVAASQLDEEKDVLSEARARLQSENPRELYFEFIKDCIKNLVTADKSKKYRFAQQLNDVALMGLGIWQEDLGLRSTGSKSFDLSSEPKWDIIKNHIDQTVIGNSFFEEINVPSDEELWSTDFPLRMSACDASQHRFKLKTPLNKSWATPVVVNNSAGTIKERASKNSIWRHVSVPKDTKEYEDWVILGPDDYANLEDGDYEWAAKSSMDVGQFFVEETFIFKHGGLALKPDVHFRDGRIFPQDHLMNCRIENRHGQLTREAIYRMVATCRTAKELKILSCGVAKQVNLKVYSTIINWYITRQMSKENWNPTGNVLNDSEIIRHILHNKDFDGSLFNKVLISCPILRRFHTASNLNRRTRNQVDRDLDNLGSIYHSRDISAKDIVTEALKINIVMFFAGHCKTDEMYIPRYEYVVFDDEDLRKTPTMINRILSALRLAGFDVDEDHLWGLDEPIVTLVPTPLLVAHDISKKMGQELSSNFAQKAIAEFLRKLKGK
jgi:hypothetical protein